MLKMLFTSDHITLQAGFNVIIDGRKNRGGILKHGYRPLDTVLL